ncbi:hypothetical protein LTS18_005461 [Coniosporium uncinatum]|uniref:Uncharacterized protein n=1 Tax=Coniosporium uncinatum TaxID=93489 RepID=A0ACC3D4P7_9PEZI|nr:hypothetical protein LTS18_005461 [Coniosporium uncinatum]
MSSATKVAFEEHVALLKTCRLSESRSGRIRASRTCFSAWKMASQMPTPIFNHVMRVFCYANQIAQNEVSPIESKERANRNVALLYVACMLHDIGVLEKFNGSARFEVEGADAAAEMLREEDFGEEDIREVWIAIACHTSPGIAERIGVLARLVRKAVVYDFREKIREKNEAARSLGDIMEAAGMLLRLDIEKYLGDAVVKQAIDKPKKAPHGSWPGCLLDAYNKEPLFDGVNAAF